MVSVSTSLIFHCGVLVPEAPERLLGTCGCSPELAMYLLMAYLFFLVLVIQYWRL